MADHGRALIMVLMVVVFWLNIGAQQPAAPRDQAFIRETADAVASVVSREYFDANVAGRASARWLVARRTRPPIGDVRQVNLRVKRILSESNL